jgi:hypothetical protein
MMSAVKVFRVSDKGIVSGLVCVVRGGPRNVGVYVLTSGRGMAGTIGRAGSWGTSSIPGELSHEESRGRLLHKRACREGSIAWHAALHNCSNFCSSIFRVWLLDCFVRPALDNVE